MKKIKILQFPIRSSNGGVTQYALKNWAFINRQYFQMDFATMSPTLNFEDKLRNQGCQIFHISNYAEDNMANFYASFYAIFKHNKYDIVHLHTPRWKSLVAEQAANDAGIDRILIHAHGVSIPTMDEQQRLQELERHNIIRSELTPDMATDYWACSWPAAKFLFGDRIPREQIRIMPNAIEIERFLYIPVQRQKIRAALGLDDCYVIGHVGRLAYPKNQLFLINVLKQLCKDNPLVRLLLVGDGEDRDVLEKYVEENDLKDYVIFAGFRNDIEKMLQAIDVFVLPSFFEGFPLALLEAQAAGLHCYVSDSITQEINIANHVTFLPLDETVWAEALLEASRRPYIRENMYGAMTEAGFNIRYQIKEIEKGYRGEL